MVIPMMIIQRLFHCVSSMVVLAILGVILGWPSIKRFGICQHLDEYAHAVRGGSCAIGEKERILDLLDELQERVNRGESISSLRWFRHDQAICPLLEDGITSEKARLIERELLKARDELVSAERERTAKP
jgi:hypothetical protein